MSVRILIATPMRGGASPLAADVKYGYARALRRYARDMMVDVLDPHEILAPEDLDDLGYGPDLVRSRSRIVRAACSSARAYTHVWWWDADVLLRDPLIITRMIMANRDIIGCLYPRKLRRWNLVAKYAAEESAAGRPPTADGCEMASVDYPLRTDRTPVRNNVAEVDALGMGFMLTKVDVLRAMWDRYESSLSFGDVMNGQRIPTVAMFQLVTPQERGEDGTGPLLSEDYSFCWRAQQAGYKVHLYCGPGTPLDHAGTDVYRGTPDTVC